MRNRCSSRPPSRHATEIATAEQQTDTLKRLGLDVSPLSPGVLALRARPAALAGGDVVELGAACSPSWQVGPAT